MVVGMVVVFHRTGAGRKGHGLAVGRVEVGAPPGLDPFVERSTRFGRAGADQPLERGERRAVVARVGLGLAGRIA